MRVIDALAVLGCAVALSGCATAIPFYEPPLPQPVSHDTGNSTDPCRNLTEAERASNALCKTH